MPASRSFDLPRATLQLLALGALIATSFYILSPFLIAVTWAIMIAVSTWPLFLQVQGTLGGRRSLAVAVMTIALLLILVVPLYFAIVAIVENAMQFAEWSKSVGILSLPPAPGWLEQVPVFGSKLASLWKQIAAATPEELSARLSPYAQKLVVWFVRQVGNVGLLLLQFLLTVIVAAIVFANGDSAANGALSFARRLAGKRGEAAVQLAAQAIRGVALGVVVTAILQASAAGIGLWVVGVPFATLLTAVAFILCVAQLGPGLVLIPAVFWVYAVDGAVWGTGFLLWSIFCGTFDNVVRPVLIKRGADLPLLLIFAGVIGGLIAFGVIGLFIGPVVLAVAYTLLAEWVSEGPAPEDDVVSPL